MKGRIIAEYYPDCGICNNIDCSLAANSAKKALANAKERGWKVARAHGLVCKYCVAHRL